MSEVQKSRGSARLIRAYESKVCEVNAVAETIRDRHPQEGWSWLDYCRLGCFLICVRRRQTGKKTEAFYRTALRRNWRELGYAEVSILRASAPFMVGEFERFDRLDAITLRFTDADTDVGTGDDVELAPTARQALFSNRVVYFDERLQPGIDSTGGAQ